MESDQRSGKTDIQSLSERKQKGGRWSPQSEHYANQPSMLPSQHHCFPKCPSVYPSPERRAARHLSGQSAPKIGREAPPLRRGAANAERVGRESLLEGGGAAGSGAQFKCGVQLTDKPVEHASIGAPPSGRTDTRSSTSRRAQTTLTLVLKKIGPIQWIGLTYRADDFSALTLTFQNCDIQADDFIHDKLL